MPASNEKRSKATPKRRGAEVSAIARLLASSEEYLGQYILSRILEGMCCGTQNARSRPFVPMRAILSSFAVYGLLTRYLCAGSTVSGMIGSHTVRHLWALARTAEMQRSGLHTSFFGLNTALNCQF